MDISDTTHSHEWKVVQEPAYNRVNPGIVDLVDFRGFKIFITTLPANQIPSDHETKDAEGSSAAPIYCWVTQEEVFDD